MKKKSVAPDWGVASINPEAAGGEEADGGEQVTSKLVVAGRDPSEIFATVETSLDDIAYPGDFDI